MNVFVFVFVIVFVTVIVFVFVFVFVIVFVFVLLSSPIQELGPAATPFVVGVALLAILADRKQP